MKVVEVTREILDANPGKLFARYLLDNGQETDGFISWKAGETVWKTRASSLRLQAQGKSGNLAVLITKARQGLGLPTTMPAGKARAKSARGVPVQFAGDSVAFVGRGIAYNATAKAFAVARGIIPALDKLLAPNLWYEVDNQGEPVATGEYFDCLGFRGKTPDEAIRAAKAAARNTKNKELFMRIVSAEFDGTLPDIVKKIEPQNSSKHKWLQENPIE